MSERRNRKWVLARRREGPVGESNFRWVEEPAPTPGPGQMLVRNRWLSFDPTQVLAIGRAGAADDGSGDLPIGSTMSSLALSDVLESNHPEFRPGDVVFGQTGWEDYSVTDGVAFNPTYRVPPDVPPDWAAGALGVTGLAAYFGLHEIGRPKAGETIALSGAAGGVGSIAAQLAKLEGLRVVGIAGSAAKCRWLLEEAGIDGAIDYRREDVAARLRELCPDGLDIFFENSGGAVLDIALEQLRPRARVVLCGATSAYGAEGTPPGLTNYVNLLMQKARMEGFYARDYLPRYGEAVAAMLPLLRSGRMKSKADIAHGLRSAPATLARLLAGENVSKQLLRIDEPTP